MSDPRDTPKAAIARAEPPKARQVLVQRNPIPESNRMLSDAYHTLASQLGKFRSHGERERFDVKDATAFNKIVTSIATLQELERKNAALLELGKLSPAELAALAGQATALLAGKDGPEDPTR